MTKIDEEVTKELKELKEKFEKRISQELHELEKKLTCEMHKELSVICHKHEIAVVDNFDFSNGYEDGAEQYFYYVENKDEALARLASDQFAACELFVNNEITQCSIWNDPSDDWDGYNRMENLEKMVIPISFLDSFNFDKK